MPVSKVKNEINYDTVIKSLRGREVSCLVAKTPERSRESTPRKIARYCEIESNHLTRSELTRRLKKRSYGGSETVQSSAIELPNKKAKSFGGRPRKSSTLSQSTPTCDAQKRTYRKRGSTLVHSKTRTRASAFYLDFVQHDEVKQTEVPKKRAYRKKSLQLPVVKTPKKVASVESACLWMDDNANAPPTPTQVTPQKRRAYSRKIPPVPHNTPVVFTSTSTRRSESASTISSLGLVDPSISGSGLQKSIASLADDDSTCTGSCVSWDSATTVSGGKRRGRGGGRRSLWFRDDLDQEEEEAEVSEYELLRRKNIEENLKMLRQMFAGTDFQLEKKLETPKSRKSYTKVPLPPPRPKSARLEDRTPLDFSRLTHKLSLT